MKAFQSAPPVRGATHSRQSQCDVQACFNPRPPCGERPGAQARTAGSVCFNPRPPCGERHVPTNNESGRAAFQSAPPVRGATKHAGDSLLLVGVSIRAPRAGSDLRELVLAGQCTLFQSAPPVRGATQTYPTPRTPKSCFNPRPPCGERPVNSAVDLWRSLFQSAPPVRGATYETVVNVTTTNVSIRAPRAGSDTRSCVCSKPVSSFNPRPPCGERP